MVYFKRGLLGAYKGDGNIHDQIMNSPNLYILNHGRTLYIILSTNSTLLVFDSVL